MATIGAHGRGAGQVGGANTQWTSSSSTAAPDPRTIMLLLDEELMLELGGGTGTAQGW